MSQVTIIEVAAAAGVSKTTASDILRQAARQYHPSTVEKVHRVAAQLGYRANAAARLLRQGRTNIIGLVVSVKQRPHMNTWAVAAHNECVKRGYQPVLFEPLHLLPQKHFSPFPSVEMLAGLISIDLSMERDLPDYYAQLRDGLPIVALYPTRVQAVDTVYTDYVQSIETAFEHVVKLGHRRITTPYLPESNVPSETMKMTGWRKACRRFKLKAEETRPIVMQDLPLPRSSGGMVSTLDYIQSIGTRIIDMLTSTRGSASQPTALIGLGDEVAMMVIARLTQLGWKLPQELSIVGVDGIDFGEYSSPRLTTMVHPYETVAACAFDRLLHRIENGITYAAEPPQSQAIATHLQIRDSTGAPSRQN